MKTLSEVLNAIKAGRESQCLDGRDYMRLSDFVPEHELHTPGFALTEGASHSPKEWTEENIIAQLKEDVTFGHEKAVDERGLSAWMMYEVVKMWLWILDDPLQHHEDYYPYGRPLFTAVADKYDFKLPVHC